MKTIVKTIACIALVMFSAACQKELVNPENEIQETPDPVVITASRIATKVSYAENSTTHNLVGSWEVNDVIFGFTSEGTTVSFNVVSVDSDTGVATLTQTTSVSLTEGTVVHAIYCPGKTAADLSDQTLAVDFSSQSANVIPVLLLSTATVASNSLSFTFDNAVSVIGIKNPVFPGSTGATKVLNITVSGHEIVSSGVVSVSGGSLVFTGNAPDKFITKTINAAPITDGDNFTIANPVYIVVPAGPIATISAIDNRSNFFTYSVNQTAATSKYYVLNNKEFTKVKLPESTEVSAGGVVWAEANLGTDSETLMGDIYRWSDTGKIYSERVNTTTVSFDEGHTGGFNTYEGECYFSGSTYTKYNTADNKLVLDPVDDIVQLTYPGSGWRMPTLAEFNALFALDGVTYNSGTENNVGTTVTQGEKSVFFRGTASVCAPSSQNKTTIGKKGRYWASTISQANLKSNGGNPDYVQINTDGTKAAAPTYSNAYRHSGYLIRPVRQ